MKKLIAEFGYRLTSPKGYGWLSNPEEACLQMCGRQVEYAKAKIGHFDIDSVYFLKNGSLIHAFKANITDDFGRRVKHNIEIFQFDTTISSTANPVTLNWLENLSSKQKLIAPTVDEAIKAIEELASLLPKTLFCNLELVISNTKHYNNQVIIGESELYEMRPVTNITKLLIAEPKAFYNSLIASWQQLKDFADVSMGCAEPKKVAAYICDYYHQTKNLPAQLEITEQVGIFAINQIIERLPKLAHLVAEKLVENDPHANFITQLNLRAKTFVIGKVSELGVAAIKNLQSSQEVPVNQWFSKVPMKHIKYIKFDLYSCDNLMYLCQDKNICGLIFKLALHLNWRLDQLAVLIEHCDGKESFNALLKNLNNLSTKELIWLSENVHCFYSKTLVLGLIKQRSLLSYLSFR